MNKEEEVTRPEGMSKKRTDLEMKKRAKEQSAGDVHDLPIKVEVLRPGLVVVRRVATRAVQQAIVAKFLEIGDHPTDGFYEESTPEGTHTTTTTTPTTTRKLNSTTTRGRIYRELAFYGDDVSRWMLEYTAKAVQLAQAADPAMPHMVPSHALLLYYASNRGIGEHRDDGPNDGEGDAPIVSFNFGKSVLYKVRMDKKTEAKMDVRLDAGDVILFGGPCRMIYHSVQILKETVSPYPDLLPTRMNLTLRHAPSVIGREEEFKTFKPTELFWKNKKN